MYDTAIQRGPAEPTPAHPPRRPPPRAAEVCDSLAAIDEALHAFRRALAGYQHCAGALRSASGALGEGERIKAPPILRFPAALDGRAQFECCVDLRQLPPDQAQFMLSAMSAGLLRDAYAALSVFEQHAAALRPLLDADCAALFGAEAAPAAPRPTLVPLVGEAARVDPA